MKAVFIVGLHRSGSTIFSLVLQNLKGFFGVGEVYGLISNPSRHAPCECGEWNNQCKFWGKITPGLSDCESLSDRYTIAMNEAFKYGIPVDSSKRLDALRLLRKVNNIDLSVIFIVRDVRAWITSQKLFGVGHNSIRLCLRWYSKNRKIKDYLDGTGVRYMQIGYEEFALYPEETMKTVREFLDAEGEIRFNQHGHALSGNRMKREPKKKSRIIYDNRWFYHGKFWRLPSFLMPWVMTFNRKMVYKNIKTPFSESSLDN